MKKAKRGGRLLYIGILRFAAPLLDLVMIQMTQTSASRDLFEVLHTYRCRSDIDQVPHLVLLGQG